MQRPRLCLVHSPRVLARAFQDLGCEILADLTPEGGGELDLAQALDGRSPDLLLQVESLGPRLVLRGLEDLSCRKVFWAVDPHLNGFWQAAYGRLFDLVLSTQTKWDADLTALGQDNVRHLPWFAPDLPWTPWSRREHEICFVGRVTAQRPARRWLVEFLRQRYGARLTLASDVGYSEMLALYQAARLAPNESISGEINFRLFEAAAAGCLVLGQNIGPEQDALFEPGRELEVFAHAAELQALLDARLKNPRSAEILARAAWERAQDGHLARHRAARLLDLAESCGQGAARGPDAAAWRGLTLFLLWEAGRWPSLGPADMAALLGGLPAWPAVLAARTRCLALAEAPAETLLPGLAALLAAGAGAGDTAVDLAGSMAGLRLGRFDLARQFWFRRLKALPRPDKALREPPGDPVRLCLLWAGLLRRTGPLLRPGFPFDPARHLPACAMECLLLALALRPGDLDALRALDGLLASRPGLDQMRVGFLSELTLRQRHHWRLNLALGLADLKSFRLEAGLDELALALAQARAEGRETAFRRLLAAQDPKGLLGRTLA